MTVIELMCKLRLFAANSSPQSCKIRLLPVERGAFPSSMVDGIESVRLRLEQVLADLDRMEANDMHFDERLLAEMRSLVRYFREQGFAIHLVREGRSLSVRIEKERW